MMGSFMSKAMFRFSFFLWDIYEKNKHTGLYIPPEQSKLTQICVSHIDRDQSVQMHNLL